MTVTARFHDEVLRDLVVNAGDAVIYRIAAFIRDVTERFEQDRALRRRVAELETLRS